MFIQTGFSVAQAKVSPHRASDAASLIAFAQNIGIVLALAISGSVFQNQALDSLQELLPGIPREALRGAISGSKTIPAETQAKVIHAIVDAMSHTYYLVIAAAVMTAVGSLFFKVEHLHTSNSELS